MAGGRPRKPIDHHTTTGSYRRDRHGLLPGARVTARRAKRSDPYENPMFPWKAIFEYGADYFDELDLGHGTDKAALRRDPRVKAAWIEYGAEYLEIRIPEPGRPAEPWALGKFGPPPGWDGGDQIPRAPRNRRPSR